MDSDNLTLRSIAEEHSKMQATNGPPRTDWFADDKGKGFRIALMAVAAWFLFRAFTR